MASEPPVQIQRRYVYEQNTDRGICKTGLYNAMSGRNYDNPELLEINTIKNVIYMTYYNDLSFVIDSRLSLYEHQSTYNPNMPLRFIIYMGELLAALTKDENLYGSRIIPIPTPRFVVFYNGREERPDYEQMCLSDSYTIQNESINLELKADVYNVNVGHNPALLKACRTLGEYAEYVRRVRYYAETTPIEVAVDRAIEECIRENVLRDFLQTQRVEAKTMSIYEYNEEEHMRMEREEWFERGQKSRDAEIEQERKKAEEERVKREQAEAKLADLQAELDKLKSSSN